MSSIDPTKPHPESFFATTGHGTYQATALIVGPWDPQLQHGSPPAALLGKTLASSAPVSIRPARITFDFFSPVPVGETAIEVNVVRPGKRIHLSAASLTCQGRTTMRAGAWHILSEAGRRPRVQAEFAPPEIPPPRVPFVFFPDVLYFPYADAIDWRFVEGSPSEQGPATVWTRCQTPIVDSDPLSLLDRVLIAVDAANGISSVLPISTWTFVPVALTVVLGSLPVGEWIGMAATTNIGADGIGYTTTQLFDQGKETDLGPHVCPRW